jgi:hypothetical protein
MKTSTMVEQFVFNTVLVRSHVVDQSQRAVDELRVGNTYGHVVEISRNYALWPVDLGVSTSVRDLAQLAFIADGLEKQDWGFQTVLEPNHGDGKRVAILVCKDKKSSKEMLRTTVAMSGRSDLLLLEVDVR